MHSTYFDGAEDERSMTNGTLQWTLDSPGWLPISDSTDAQQVIDWVDRCVELLQATWKWTASDDELAGLRAELLRAYTDRMESGADAEFVVWPIREAPPTKVRAMGLDRAAYHEPNPAGSQATLFRTDALGDGIELNRMVPPQGGGIPMLTTMFVFEGDDDVLLVTMDPVPPMARQVFHGDLIALLASLRIETAPGIPFAATRRPWMVEATRREQWQTDEDS